MEWERKVLEHQNLEEPELEGPMHVPIDGTAIETITKATKTKERITRGATTSEKIHWRESAKVSHKRVFTWPGQITSPNKEETNIARGRDENLQSRWQRGLGCSRTQPQACDWHRLPILRQLDQELESISQELANSSQ